MSVIRNQHYRQAYRKPTDSVSPEDGFAASCKSLIGAGMVQYFSAEYWMAFESFGLMSLVLETQILFSVVWTEDRISSSRLSLSGESMRDDGNVELCAKQPPAWPKQHSVAFPSRNRRQLRQSLAIPIVVRRIR